MSFTLKDIEEEFDRLDNSGEPIEADGYEWESVLEALENEYDIETNLGLVKFVDSFVDRLENDGTPAFLIFTVGDDPRLFAYSGYYSSYYGTEYDGDVVEIEKYTQTIERVRVK